MPFYTSCKSIAWDIVSCCDRMRAHDIDIQSPNVSPVVLRSEMTTTPVSSYNSRKTQRKGTLRSNKREYGYDDAMAEHITDRVFYYNTILYNPEAAKAIYRRVLLNFTLKYDAISDEIPQVLGLPILPYYGKAVQLHNGKTAKPIGTLHLQWQIYNGKKAYKTKFLVIKDNHFDMLLGRSSIKKYKLWKEDGDIEKRLQYPC
ncbi:hypothetical protein BJX63DRAFT_243960 [Aspergillus granulosus]|uniref:Uncharacterized protein n=1 Tax=Aspergillus granulosus TaxID=176169 RepID=A0ABR4HAK7_9EURO